MQDIKEIIRSLPELAEACATGFAKAGKISDDADRQFSSWLAQKMNGQLGYMADHRHLRQDPRMLLPDAKTVISIAFPYLPAEIRDNKLPQIARYAYGKDYHNILRKRLKKAVKTLSGQLGGQYRICIDSAPIPERYWAIRAGIGRRALNGCIIIDGFGSYIFLTEILTTLEIEPDRPSTDICLGCRRCIDACPANALTPDGLDASRCISALTIEHKGEWNDEEQRIMSSPDAKNTLFGCDRCQTVCPHNNGIIPTPITEFQPTPHTLTLTAEDILQVTPSDFDTRYAGTPMRRPGLPALRRNALNTLRHPHHKT